MKSYLPILLLILAGCKPEKKPDITADLKELQAYFHIPGIAAIVTQGDETLYENYLGFADEENKVPMDSVTVIPMASLTKMFTGYLLRQLSPGVMDEPVNHYVSFSPEVPDSIKVKHVLSHTSQGQVGKHFYYSGRFSWLKPVIEDSRHETFRNLVHESIIVPYSLHHTFLLEDSTDLAGRRFAKPYVFEGETKPGFIDYGFSSSAGITSTVRDLAKFSKALDTTPDFDEQYNYGLFSQRIEGVKILWAYGQYDCYSSLFIKVPGRDLTFVIAANNSLMSDPARLIYGDVTTSLFALSLFRNFLNIDLPAEKLRARAVAESYMGMYDPKRAENSKVLLREVFRNHNSNDNLATMHNISFLKEIAAHSGQANFTEFDPQLRSIGKKLLAIDVDNPYANIYMASNYGSSNDVDSARLFFERVVEARNFSPNWYTNEARKWLKEHALP